MLNRKNRSCVTADYLRFAGRCSCGCLLKRSARIDRVAYSVCTRCVSRGAGVDTPLAKYVSSPVGLRYQLHWFPCSPEEGRIHND